MRTITVRPGATLWLGAVALALSLGLPGAARAAPAHQDHAGPVAEMRLNDGQKWQTDDALRNGMTAIRTALGAALPQIHGGTLTAGAYAALADKVQEQVDFITANCRLPEDADQQLHIALVQVLDGIEGMRGTTDQARGAIAIAQALDAYGQRFDHPGWTALAD